MYNSWDGVRRDIEVIYENRLHPCYSNYQRGYHKTTAKSLLRNKKWTPYKIYEAMEFMNIDSYDEIPGNGLTDKLIHILKEQGRKPEDISFNPIDITK